MNGRKVSKARKKNKELLTGLIALQKSSIMS